MLPQMVSEPKYQHFRNADTRDWNVAESSLTAQHVTTSLLTGRFISTVRAAWVCEVRTEGVWCR